MQLKKQIMLAVMTLAVTLPAVKAAETPMGPHVVTSGSASIEVPPDMATLSIEVSHTDMDPVQAKKIVDDQVAQYFKFLQQNGVGKKEISAANIRTSPEYDYQNDRKPELKGYRAMRSVEVKVMKLDKLNQLLDGALKAGLKEIRAVDFTVAEPDNFRAQVRQKAIEEATAQAQALARGFGTKLGAVYSIRYQVRNTEPVFARMAMMDAQNAPTNKVDDTYQQQNITFRDQVDVVFELRR